MIERWLNILPKMMYRGVFVKNQTEYWLKDKYKQSVVLGLISVILKGFTVRQTHIQTVVMSLLGWCSDKCFFLEANIKRLD